MSQIEEIRNAITDAIELDGPGNANFTNPILTVGDCREILSILDAALSPVGAGVGTRDQLRRYADAEIRQRARALFVAQATATSQQSASPSPPQGYQDTAALRPPPMPTSPDTNNQEK